MRMPIISLFVEFRKEITPNSGLVLLVGCRLFTTISGLNGFLVHAILQGVNLVNKLLTILMTLWTKKRMYLSLKGEIIFYLILQIKGSIFHHHAVEKGAAVIAK